MRKLLILGSSLGSVDIVRKAHAMGCHVIVTDYVPVELSQAKREADEYWAVSTADLDELEVRCHREGVNAVYSGVSEFNLDRVLDLCERLGLPCYFDRRAWGYARDKSRFKEQCRAVGVPVTREFKIDDELVRRVCAPALSTGAALSAAMTDTAIFPAQDIPFPVVVKPVDGCGNAGVSFCHDAVQLARALRLVRSVSRDPRVLVEEYVRGTEYCNVYALADGEASLLSIRSVFVEPGYPTNMYSLATTVSAHVEEYVRDVDPAVVRLLKRCGCRDGVAFVQAIRDHEGRYHFFEMGHRLSADMVFDKMVDMTGFDAVRWMLELQLGTKHGVNQLPRPQVNPYKECASAYMLFAAQGGVVSRVVVKEDLVGLQTEAPGETVARPSDGVSIELIVHPGDEVRQWQLMGRLTFHSKGCDELCETIRRINQRIRIINEVGQDMILYFTDFDHVLATAMQALSGSS